jgi:hypothetical protein
MLQETDSLLLYELIDHVAKNGANCVKALVRLANIRKTDIVEQNLLNDEDSDRLTKF